MEHCQNQKSDKVPSVFCKHITNLISPFEVPGGEKLGGLMSLTSNEMFAELLDQGYSFDLAYMIVSKTAVISLDSARYIYNVRLDIINTKAQIELSADNDYLCESLVDLEEEYAYMRTLGDKVA